MDGESRPNGGPSDGSSPDGSGSNCQGTTRRAVLRAGVASLTAGIAGCQRHVGRADRGPPTPLPESAATGGRGWRGYAADAGNTGVAVGERGPLFDGRVDWSLALGYGAPTAAAVADGTVYVGDPGGGSTGLVTASLATGAVEWAFECPPVTATPAVGRDLVFAPTAATGRVHAVDRTSGSQRWDASVSDYRGAAPAVAGETLYCGVAEGVVALDARTGTERWRRAVPGYAGNSTPAVAGGTVYVGGRGVTALDAVDGRRRWQWLDGGDAGTPTATGAGVFAVARGPDEGVASLAPDDGAVRWRTSLSVQRGVGGLTVTDGRVVVPTADGVAALGRSDGRPRWRVAGRGVPLGPAAAAGDRYYLPWRSNRTESVVALSPADGRFVWGNVVGTDEPYDGLGHVAVAGGRVLVGYVSSEDTTLLALVEG